MKKLIALALVLGVASVGSAREPMFAPANSLALQPTPIAPTPMFPVPDAGIAQPTPVQVQGSTVQSAPVVVSQPGIIICDACNAGAMPLFRAVRVRAPRNIAPCAVEKIVSVPDPCDPCRCVFVSICVPPCACERVHCDRKGDVTFDYGKYSVEVSTGRRGTLVVSYKD